MSAPARPTSKAKPRRAPPVLPGQLELFGAPEASPVTETPIPAAPTTPTPKSRALRNPHRRAPSKDRLAKPTTTAIAAPAPPAAVTAPMSHPNSKPAPASPDEWWTTRIVCAFLKISRKTLWERRRDQALGFPSPLHLGSARNLYRASAVRAWAERMAADARSA